MLKVANKMQIKLYKLLTKKNKANYSKLKKKQKFLLKVFVNKTDTFYGCCMFNKELL